MSEPDRLCMLGERVIIKEIWKHRNRTCIIMEMRICMEKFGIGTFHNGYVETSKKNYGKDYEKLGKKINTEELTFSGNWKPTFSNMWFIGFDTGHYWNEINPESKTFKVVRVATERLCNEMIKKGV